VVSRPIILTLSVSIKEQKGDRNGTKRKAVMLTLDMSREQDCRGFWGAPSNVQTFE
jgi:hypothetical protein